MTIKPRPRREPVDPLDADVKQQWVTALRSGDYKQGRGRLYNPDTHTFCCLGVLCAVLGYPYDGDAGTGARGPNYLPLEPILGEAIGALAAMNDHSASFSEIADYIEREL